MAKNLFGTDGIRGVAGEYPLDARTVASLGIALADDLKNQGVGHLPVLIGMDTRESGPGIAAQLAWGLAQHGLGVRFAGVLTTPGVAYLTRTGEYAAGVMISASHNPYHDNGIKVFARTGYKLPDADEHLIEEEIFRLLPDLTVPVEFAPLNQDLPVVGYLNFLRQAVPGSLSGLRIVMDCGNGAASRLAPEMFRAAGAEVETIGCEPNGRNINLHCGSLHLEGLRERVIAAKADAGVAFDGDADRAMLIAPSGRVIDGDAIMLIAGRRLQADGHLKGDLVVSTVMSNLGLEKALERLGITMLRTPVGDKYVLEEMIRQDAALGGEQSGHVIFREFATTGDGMLTALKVLETCAQAKQSLDELAGDLKVFPQLLKNLRVKERRPLDQLPGVGRAIRECEAELAGSGRIVVRFSGTEPLLRIMLEGPDQAQIERMAEHIAKAARAELGEAEAR